MPPKPRHRRYKRMTPTELAELKQMHTDGHPVSEIANHLNICQQKVRFHLRKLDLTPKKRHGCILEKDIPLFLKQWNSHRLAPAIARQFRITKQQLYTAVRKLREEGYDIIFRHYKYKHLNPTT